MEGAPRPAEGRPGGAPSGWEGYREHPYRIFFPLGFLLAWAGVSHWLLHSLGILADYRPVFHAIAQIQGFMTCFAVGFLFTAIPRRTGTASPSRAELVLAALAPVVTSVAAWYSRFAISQAAWLVLMALMLHFVTRRFVRGGRRPPAGFVWIPVALLMGVGGSVLISSYGVLGDEYFELHELGRLYLLQGMFVCLVLGAGVMVLPLLTRGASSTDFGARSGDRVRLAAHILMALLLTASFWVEQAVSLRGGLAARAAIVLAVLLGSSGLTRRPTLPGWQRRLVWLAGWMIPIGYALAAWLPAQKKAGLHVVFIAGFALMALSVGLHVTVSHGGRPELARRFLWPVAMFGGLLLLATGARVLAEFDRPHFFGWLAASAILFLLGSLIWAWVTFGGTRAQRDEPALVEARGMSIASIGG